MLGVARDVIGDRGVLAATEPLGKVFGQPLERVSVRRRSSHHSALGRSRPLVGGIIPESSSMPSAGDRISLSRRSART